MSSFTRVFLSSTAQDANYRSLLVAAAKAARLPVLFVEMPNSVTDARRRHALCRARLQQCDAAIVLASGHAARSLVVEADMDAIRESGKPLHAIMAGCPRNAVNVPKEWGVSMVLSWNWALILEFLQRLHPELLQLRKAG